MNDIKTKIDHDTTIFEKWSVRKIIQYILGDPNAEMSYIYVYTEIPGSFWIPSGNYPRDLECSDVTREGM